MAGRARTTPRHGVITKTHVQQNAKKVCQDPKVAETGADKYLRTGNPAGF
jgi:hypothetical protein